MGTKQGYRRYAKKAKVGAKRVVQSRSKVRKVGRRLEEDLVAVERRAAGGARRLEKAAVSDVRRAEKRAVRDIKHLGKDIDLFCDNCGKAMRPGGHVARMFGGKELRFCSALCSAKFRPEGY